MNSTPTRCSFTYRGQAATATLDGSKVCVQWSGGIHTGTYRSGMVQLSPPNPIGVEAGAALRSQLGQKIEVERSDNPEGRVRAEVREAIGALPDVYLMANPCGQAEFYNPATNSIRVVPYGLEDGSPDFIVALRRGGVALMMGLETKAPGQKPRPNQQECHGRWRRAGILVYTVQSGAEALLAIEDARGKQ